MRGRAAGSASPSGVRLAELIGDSAGIVAVREQVERLLGGRAAGRLPNLLIVGETGTGKGLLARALHDASLRRSGPFVDINCAAIPENLLEAELFGVERGAFTGADRSRRGLFQTAHQGTLFLDEIALASAGVQSKLLRALEDRTVRPVGSTRAEPVDVWILAATNEDLDAAMRTGRFRRDLYHRLAVLTLRLPPLRERGADVIRLAEHFLARACADYSLGPKGLGEDARSAIRAHGWPGNVRELANVIERGALLSDGPVVTGATLQLPVAPSGARPDAGQAAARPRLPTLAGAGEGERLREALEATGWNLSQTAARLAIPRNTLRYRMERHGLREPPPSRRPREAEAAGRRRLALLRIALAAPAAASAEAGAVRVLDAIAEKVQVFGGRIEQMTGDVVGAAFGLEPIEDAPRRAALAAIAARKAVERSAPPERVPPVAAAIDVRECGVVSSAGGLDLDDASKATVWPALEALATAGRPDDTLVSEAAAASLRRRFDLVLASPDREAPGRVYRLTGRERAGFGPAERMTEFVGRDQELTILEARLDSATSGRGQVVAIIGEAGIGKSRLLFEVRQRLAGAEVTYLEGRCASYGQGIPYLPMLDILRQCAGIAESDAPPAAAEKVQAVLTALDAPEGHAPYLLSLLGAADAGEGLRDVNPALSRTRTFEALRYLVSALGRRRPLVLAIEDLHWIDKTSDEVLATLVDGIQGVPVLIAVTYRPGYEPAWLPRAHVTQLALPPLSPHESGAVLRSALRSDAVPPEVADALSARGEGNPFFLEELAHSLREEGGAGRRAPVPDSIHAVLAARIDRLAIGDRRLLQAAAVIGKDVPLAVLQAITGDEPTRLRERLRLLQAGDFLWETQPAPHAEYTFKHALTHEVAYGTLAPAARRDLHAKVARLLIGTDQGPVARRPEAIARHLTAADLPAEALPYWLEAGRNAIRRSANVEAVSHLTTAIALLQREPETPARDRTELELQLTLGPALITTRGYGSPEVAAVYGRAEALCAQLGDSLELFSALWGIWMFRLIRGDLRQARATAERLLDVAARTDNADLLVEAHLALGVPLIYQGHLADARRHIEKGLSLYDPGRHAAHAFRYGQDPQVGGLGFLAWTLVLQGHEAQALASVEAARRRADGLGHTFSRAVALYFSALVNELRGDYVSTLRDAERLIAVAGEHHFPLWVAGAMGLRGRALAMLGRPAEGLALMTQGLETWRATGAGAAGMYFLRNLAEAHRAVGAVEQALTAVDDGLAEAERRDYHAGEPELHRLRAEILAMDPARWPEAEASFRHAVALAREQGSGLFLRRAIASFGHHLRQRGRTAEAEELAAEDAPAGA